MRLLVVSDLHIAGEADPLYFSLLSFLREQPKTGDTVVLAGDTFDLFIGSKAIYRSRYREFFEELRHAGERGVKLHYIEGNHDFNIRKAFVGIPGMTIHPHHVIVELHGKKFFVAHGDTVDPSDYGYRVLRLFLRSPIIKFFVALMPGEVIDWIGRTGSRRSSKTKPRNPTQLPIKRLEHVRKAYRNYAAERLSQGYDFVVLGHCHDLDQMQFFIGERRGQYVNVGYPRIHKSFLSWTAGDDKIHREALPLC